MLAVCAMSLIWPDLAFSETSTSLPQTFSSAKAAADALVKASDANDTKTLLVLFAPNGQDLIESGDPAEDARARARFAVLAHKKLVLVPDPADPSKTFISVGEEDWPFPVPLIQKNGQWMFDSSEGQKEIRSRYIGAHELTAIEICEGYVEAQTQYAQTHRHKGAPEYAQHIVSTPGQQDGLYWKAKKGELPPPVPADFARAAHRMEKEKRRPYHGYYFQILTVQGSHARGGEKKYIVDGAMTGGFALVAWPAHYGESGVQTFIVNQDALIYQADLGADTEMKATGLSQFDPDGTWAEVKDK
jgi:hypothetical protein